MRILLLILMTCLAAPLHAQDWRIGVMHGKWAHTKLPPLLEKVFAGELTFYESYLTSIIISRQFGAVELGFPEGGPWQDGIRFEFELTANHHTGLQDHDEVTLGVITRSPDLAGALGRLNIGWTNGLSQASSPPNYERGTDGRRGEDTVQFQYYMAFEAEYAAPQWEHARVFARLHHRSGFLGRISSSRTGSNFIGVGLRWKFSG